MFFSVVIPTYNRPQRVLEAIESVLSQSYKDFEIVVVNDGSTSDYSAVEIACKRERKIKYVFQDNQYLAAARNTGMQNASGEFICFLDDDDEFLPNHLEVLHKHILLHHNLEALYHTRTVIKSHDGSIDKLEEINKSYVSETDKVISDRFPTIAVCIHRKIAAELKFDVGLKYAEDLDYWIRVSMKWPIIKIDEFTISLLQENENKMSDFKLPNQHNHLLAYQHFKKQYSGVLPSTFLNERLKTLYRSCAELYSNTEEKRLARSFLMHWLMLDPKSAFSRQAVGILKKTLF